MLQPVASIRSIDLVAHENFPRGLESGVSPWAQRLKSLRAQELKTISKTGSPELRLPLDSTRSRHIVTNFSLSGPGPPQSLKPGASCTVAAEVK